VKIKIINPTIYDENGKLVKLKRATMPNLTVFYLAGLVPKQHEVSIVEENIQDVDINEPVDLVGITTNTFNIERAYQLTGQYRERGVKTVLGGIHASLLPDEAGLHADSVVVGEAEDAWPQVIRDAERGELRCRYQTEHRPSLERLANPRYDLMDYSKYVRDPFRKSPLIPVNTSRGCPHDCSFCTVSLYWGRKLRFRPVDEVIEEIKRTGGDTFFFTDDNFFANADRARELCEALIPLRIKYFCQMDALVYLRPELIKLAAKSGCMLSYIGFESLSPANLKAARKGFNRPEEYATLFKSFRKNGIQIYASLIFGFDADNKDLADETVRFLIKHNAALAAFFPLCPFPGTKLYAQLTNEGRIVDRHWWLTKSQNAGTSNRIRYSDGQPSGMELCKQAMPKFYSKTSIARRFCLPRKNTLFPLITNILIHYRIKKSLASFM
jgi:radical SAM superfamily enzyme YgiQ (UPF0313 family)